MSNVEWLLYCPATDSNYEFVLKKATNEQIQEVINFMKGKKGHKGRVQACERELRRREK